MRGLDEDTTYSLNHIQSFLDEEQAKHVQYLVKYRKAVLEDEHYPVSTEIVPDTHYPVLIPKSDDEDTITFCNAVSMHVREAVEQQAIEEFAKRASDFLPKHLAAHLLGMNEVKEAVALQLVMPERFHILLLGDPGTGKTDILRAASEIAFPSSFGLGSGSSKAGLSVSAVGKEVHEGLLVQANGGLCCIDELNLMQVGDRAALYNAMEKGFVSYDKGSIHQKFAADIRLLASANPKGDQFRGRDLETVRKQLPFDQALLSRFHLVFLIRKPDLKEFQAISKEVLAHKTKPLSTSDKQFLKRYLERARALSVMLSPSVEESIVTAVTKLKSREKNLLVDVTPRLTKGLASLVTAKARIELRTEATAADARAAIAILEHAFERLEAK